MKPFFLGKYFSRAALSLILLSAFEVNAQGTEIISEPGYSTNYQHYDKSLVHKNLKTYQNPGKPLSNFRLAGVKSLPLNSINYYYNLPSGVLGVTNNSQYRYDAAGRLVSEIEREAATNQILKKDSLAYDSGGKIIFRGNYYWDYTNSHWVFSSGERYSTVYNTSGQITEELVENYANAAWINAYKTIYTYANGKLTNYLNQRWDNNQSSWEAYAEVNYFYVSGGATPNEQITRMKDLTGTWVNEERRTNIVWRNFNEQEFTSYNSNTWNNGWVNPERGTFVYDAFGGYVETIEKQIYAGWVNLKRLTTSYDNHLNYTGFKEELWVNNGWVTTYVLQQMHTYNAAGELTETVFNQLSSPFNTLFLARRRVYSNFISINGTSDKFLNLSAKVYPNPVYSILNIQLPEVKGSVTATLSDVTGKTWLTKSFTSTETKQLNLEALPKGIYLLHLQTETGSTVKRIVKQ